MPETVKTILLGFFHGLRDALLGIFALYELSVADSKGVGVDQDKPRSSSTKPKTVLELRRIAKTQATDTTATETGEVVKSRKPKLHHRILQCCALNGAVILISIPFFTYIVLPLLYLIVKLLCAPYGGELEQRVWSYLSQGATLIFSALWVVPCSLLCKIISGLWFQDIADAAYRMSGGRAVAVAGGVGKVVADNLFSVIIQILFMMQSLLSHLLPPTLCQLVSYLHISLLYSLYSFEYKWIKMGWEVHRRVSWIEVHWPYFLGFGLPLCLLTSLSSSYIISGFLFSILFPFYIISANKAGDSISVYSEVPLRLFTPVMVAANTIFYRSFQSLHAKPKVTTK